jgi:hypothetical protein
MHTPRRVTLRFREVVVGVSTLIASLNSRRKVVAISVVTSVNHEE